MPTDSEGWTPNIDILPRFSILAWIRSSEYLYGRSIASQLIDIPHAQSGSVDHQSHHLRLADNKIVNAFEPVSKYTLTRVFLQDSY